MIYLGTLHWIIIAVFILLFILLSLLSLKEKKTNTMLSMIFASLLLTVFAAVISIYVLDKYTKKATILSYTTQRDYAHESIIVRGIMKNTGKSKIGYCTLKLRISNNIKRGYTNASYFTPTKSLDFLSGKKSKTNMVTVEETIAQNIAPMQQKKFFFAVRIPAHFEKPKYKLELFYH